MVNAFGTGAHSELITDALRQQTEKFGESSSISKPRQAVATVLELQNVLTERTDNTPSRREQTFVSGVSLDDLMRFRKY